MKLLLRISSQLMVVLASLIVSLVIAEIVLRVFFPDRYFDAFTATNVVDATKIWAPPVNTTNFFRHPDTGREIPLVRNNLGIRLSYDINAAKLTQSRNVAFFGDSAVANIRLIAPHTFTEVLKELLNSQGKVHEVLNFGVDGYGPAQSYLRYRELAPDIRKQLHNVIFVFYINDLSDIVADGIAGMKSDGSVELRPGLPYFPRFLSGLTRLHLTYLVVDSYNYLKGARDAMDEALSKLNAQDEPLVSSDGGSVASAQTDTTGDQLVDMPLALLNGLLLQWRADVEADGGKFYVTMIPRTDHHFMLSRFDRQLEVMDLLPFFRSVIPKYDYSQIKFRNDVHWNELGNLYAAIALFRALEERGQTPTLTSKVISSVIARHYRDIAGEWQPPDLEHQKVPP